MRAIVLPRVGGPEVLKLQARRDLIAWSADGSLRFRISRTLALAEAAHRLIESRATIGKMVLTS